MITLHPAPCLPPTDRRQSAEEAAEQSGQVQPVADEHSAWYIHVHVGYLHVMVPLTLEYLPWQSWVENEHYSIRYFERIAVFEARHL